jgi:CheY-like chemotaxis protein
MRLPKKQLRQIGANPPFGGFRKPEADYLGSLIEWRRQRLRKNGTWLLSHLAYRNLENAMSAELGRLLIVDDEMDFARFVTIVAKEVGYDVRAVDGGAGFEFQLSEWNPTVVFLDVFMPDRDGLELLGTLQRHAYRGHVVMMSGADTLYLNMAAASAKVRGLHLSATLTKPCRKQQVQDLLAKLVAPPL